MDQNEIFRKVQHAVSEVPLILVGCGHSMSYGLPGMGELAAHLQATVGKNHEGNSQWQQIKQRLDDGIGLEASLADISLPEEILSEIRVETWNLISKKDRELFEKFIFNEIDFPMARLIQKFNRPKAPLNVITTNYDRIIEYACDVAHVQVDKGYRGNYISTLPPSENFKSEEVVNLIKVHGSLDTYKNTVDQEFAIPLLEELPHGLLPNIITPGGKKYQEVLSGDSRTLLFAVDNLIGKAQSFLCIGYGFNDVQIQANIIKGIEAGKPIVVVTKELSEQAEHLLCQNAHSYITIQEGSTPDTSVLCVDKEVTVLNGTYWDVNGLLEIID